MSAIQNRYEFMLFFDVENGNPNGDPDAGNMPRIDPNTGRGLVSDVCLKRKIRDYIELRYGNRPGMAMYIAKGPTLNMKDLTVVQDLIQQKIISSPVQTKDDLKKALAEIPTDQQNAIMNAASRRYYDVRTFGAVMTSFSGTKVNGCSAIRGPVQLGFATSIDPVFPQRITLTRVVRTTEEEAATKGANVMGNKWIIPYGLYCVKGYVSAALANKMDGSQKDAGFSDEDLQIFWEALLNMFEYDRAAARGTMVSRKLIVFKHDALYGNAHAHELFDLISVKRKMANGVPTCYNDYEISVDVSRLPQGVTCQEL